MKAFHNDSAIKAKYVERMEAHRLADQIVQANGYWDGKKGCAVGCTLHSGLHLAAESEIGFPMSLMMAEDYLFEGLPDRQTSSDFAVDFLRVTPVGADLSMVGVRLVQWILVELSKHEEAQGSPHLDTLHETIHQIDVVLRFGWQSVNELVFYRLSKGAEYDREGSFPKDYKPGTKERFAAEILRVVEYACRHMKVVCEGSGHRGGDLARTIKSNATFFRNVASRRALDVDVDDADCFNKGDSAESEAYKRMTAKLLELLATAPVHE